MAADHKTTKTHAPARRAQRDQDVAAPAVEAIVPRPALTRSQLEQLQRMGGVGALLDKLPGTVTKKGAVSADQGDRELRRQIAIINSMTPRERRNPAIVDGSRRRRIAAGSGVQVQDVNRLLKQFQEMQRVMKSMKGGRLRALMGALKGGGMPPGFPGR